MSSLVSHFKEIFGHSSDVSAAAPGRVNLIGEHIDYSDGFVLPFAVKDRTYVSVRKREDRKIRVASVQRRNEIVTSSLDELKPGARGGWESYPLGVIWALGSAGGIDRGIDLLIDGQVPLGAGLSSSAALECSVAVALNQLFSLDNDLEGLARITQRAENEYVGVPCGIMDQSVSLMAHAGHALLLDCRDLSKRHIPFDVAASGLELLIIDTRVHHALIDGGYAERRSSCESVADKLGVETMRDVSIKELGASRRALTHTEFIRARHAVTEMDRVMQAVVALEDKDFTRLGHLLNESHRSLRDDYTVSCPELNAAVDAANRVGALGARMVGGGFGGSAIALINSDESKATIAAIEESYAFKKYRAPRFYTSLPSAGAEIILQPA